VPAIPGVFAPGTTLQFIRDGFHGVEGPVGMPDGSVLFCERDASRIVRIDLDDKISTFLEGVPLPTGLALDAAGRLIAVLSQRSSIATVFPPARTATLADGFEGQANDLVIDRRGGIYFTVPVNRLPGRGAGPAPSATFAPATYYLAPGGTATKVDESIAFPNGIQLSPDEKTLYVNDSRGEYLLAFDVQADGSLRARRNFARYGAGPRVPGGTVAGAADGLAVDEDGRVYSANTATGVEVFDPRGTRLGAIDMAEGAQNLAFAGPDKKTLYILGRSGVFKVHTIVTGIKSRAK
jgi:gluconolactonase